MRPSASAYESASNLSRGAIIVLFSLLCHNNDYKEIGSIGGVEVTTVDKESKPPVVK